MDEVWDGRSVYLTSFWGFTPETWGKVGFTKEGRRDTIVRETTDPLIMVIYITTNAPMADVTMRGKIAGFYVVSHQTGHRNGFTHPDQHAVSPGRWMYSLKAIRAFRFAPEYALNVDEFDQSISRRARSISASAEQLRSDQVSVLQAIPYCEVPIFGGRAAVDQRLVVPAAAKHRVRAGPVNRSGYMVSGEPFETEKELYALQLGGDTAAFLGEPANDRKIYKIGLSMSPKSRLDSFNRSLPNGAFAWAMHRSTRLDGNAPYPNFESAEAGESKMKDVLGAKLGWLGGEFYAATDQDFENAWVQGHAAALKLASRLT